MALEKPNTEDCRKLHAEVNQAVAQSHRCALLALTLFAALAALVLPKQMPDAKTPVGIPTFCGLMLTDLILLILFFLSHSYKGQIRIISTYLIVTKTSPWEAAWKEYRDTFPYLGYSKPHTVLYLSMLAVTWAYPFGLALLFDQPLTPQWAFWVQCAIGLIAMACVIATGFAGWWAIEPKAQARWSVLDKLPRPSGESSSAEPPVS